LRKFVLFPILYVCVRSVRAAALSRSRDFMLVSAKHEVDLCVKRALKNVRSKWVLKWSDWCL